jgi:putative tryptophan/tyrosine transport system substrate-binding protein
MMLYYQRLEPKPMKLTNVCLLTLVLFLALSMPSGAQQPTKGLPRVGVIFSFGTVADTPSPIYQAYTQGLRDLGYIEGKNIVLERRYAEGRLDRMAPFVQEFVQQKVDVILGVNNVVIRAAKEATKTIPIVMISSVDPVAAGYVATFAHPGGNITGLAWLNRDISAKRIELLKELFPKLSRIAILWDADAPGPTVAFKEYNAAAGAFKLELRSLEVHGPIPDLAGALQTAKNANADAVIVVGNPMMFQNLKSLFPLIAKHRLPSMTEEDRYVEAGGLISYGASLSDLYRRAAEYTVEILKGAKPADLPVKLASKFDIVVNLKTAHQIGIVVPHHVLVQADKVIK